jgi:hypothetical protein
VPISAYCLRNDITVVQLDRDSIDYFHVKRRGPRHPAGRGPAGRASPGLRRPARLPNGGGVAEPASVQRENIRLYAPSARSSCGFLTRDGRAVRSCGGLITSNRCDVCRDAPRYDDDWSRPPCFEHCELIPAGGRPSMDENHGVPRLSGRPQGHFLVSLAGAVRQVAPRWSGLALVAVHQKNTTEASRLAREPTAHCRLSIEYQYPQAPPVDYAVSIPVRLPPSASPPFRAAQQFPCVRSQRSVSSPSDRDSSRELDTFTVLRGMTLP